MKQWINRNAFSSILPRKHRASSKSRHLDAPDARPTTTAAAAPSPRGMCCILAQHSITKSAPKLLSQKARALHSKLEEAFRSMVPRLQPITLKQASRSDLWIRLGLLTLFSPTNDTAGISKLPLTSGSNSRGTD